MKVSTTYEFDVFELFVHDKGSSGTLNECDLSLALGFLLEKVDSELDRYEVQSPDECGLDRFVLHDNESAAYFTQRCNNVDEVKAYLPAEVVSALEKLNSGSWVLDRAGPYGEAHLVSDLGDHHAADKSS